MGVRIMRRWSSRRKDAVSTLTSEFDRFQDDFDQLRTKLVRLAGDTVKEFSDSPQKFADLKDVIEGRLAVIEDEIGDLGRQLRIKGGEAAGRVEKRVQERPFASLAIAFGVGLFAAQLLRRRRSS